MTTAASHQIVLRESAAAPALRAADQGVADALQSVLSENTRRVYGAQWRLFNDWCSEVALASLPAEPLTVARYLAARAGDGASIATMRLQQPWATCSTTGWSPPAPTSTHRCHTARTSTPCSVNRQISRASSCCVLTAIAVDAPAGVQIAWAGSNRRGC